MNNLPKVVTQQRRGRASNPRLLDRKSDALPLSHRATLISLMVLENLRQLCITLRPTQIERSNISYVLSVLHQVKTQKHWKYHKDTQPFFSNATTHSKQLYNQCNHLYSVTCRCTDTIVQAIRKNSKNDVWCGIFIPSTNGGGALCAGNAVALLVFGPVMP